MKKDISPKTNQSTHQLESKNKWEKKTQNGKPMHGTTRHHHKKRRSQILTKKKNNTKKTKTVEKLHGPSATENANR